MSPDSPLSCLIAGFSMYPLLRGGDRVFMQKTDRSELLPGDLIVFSHHGKRIVHRIIRIGDEVQTQGDGNPFPDEPLTPETELFLCMSFERNGITTPLKRGADGLAEFHRHQKLLRRRERMLKAARFLCRISPLKWEAEKLEQADFGEVRAFYWRKRPVAWEKDDRWHWNNPLYACFIKQGHRRKLNEKEKKEMRFAVILFRLLGEMVFGNPREFFLRQSEETRQELCRRGRLQALSPLFYYMLTDALPQNWLPVFKLDFYTQSQYDLRYTDALNKFREEFRRCEAPCIPLKGCWLAYEVYPHPALRHRRDLDFLFHRSDIERVFQTFREKGWEMHGRKPAPFFKRLHLPTLVKPGLPPLELHWHILKNRTFFDPENLWTPNCSEPEPGMESCRRLTPEAHYLLILYNMFFDRWQLACRSLLDLAFLQRKFSLDRERIVRLNREWNLNLDLGLCYRLFPEMFPGKEALFPSDTEVPDRARYAIYRLSLMECPRAVIPFLARNAGPSLLEIPPKHRKRTLLQRFRKTKTESEKLLELLTRLLPQATVFKRMYQRDKDKL